MIFLSFNSKIFIKCIAQNNFEINIFVLDKLDEFKFIIALQISLFSVDFN